MQQRSPFLKFGQVFGDVFGKENVARVTGFHDSLCQIESGAREISPTSNFGSDL
jgi:hypothetical protein